MKVRRFVPVALLMFAACSDFLGTGRHSGASVVGTYELTEFGGSPLPFSASGTQETGYHTYTPFTETLYGGSLVLNADSTFVASDSDVFVGAHRLGYMPKAGRYRATGSSVVLVGADGDAMTLSRKGPVLMTPGAQPTVFVARGTVSADYSYRSYLLAAYGSRIIPYCTSSTSCVKAGRLYLFGNGTFEVRDSSTMAGLISLPRNGTYETGRDSIVLTGTTGVQRGGLRAGTITFGPLIYALVSDPAVQLDATPRVVLPVDGAAYTDVAIDSLHVPLVGHVASATRVTVRVNGGQEHDLVLGCSGGGGCGDTFSGSIGVADGLQSGRNTLVVTAYPGAGPATDATTHVTVSAGPQLTLTIPSGAPTFTDASDLEIAGTASSQHVARVTWQGDDAVEHDVSIAPGSSVSFDFRAPLALGVNHLVVNAYNDLGSATPVAIGALRSVPATVSGAWKSIAVGGVATCGLTTAGKAYCWGGYSWLEPQRVTSPPLVSLADGVPRIYPNGDSHNPPVDEACGLDANGAAYCWKVQPSGFVASAIGSGVLFSRLVAGLRDFCGLTKGGKIDCFADDGILKPQQDSITWSDLGDFAGYCGLTTAGKALCWSGGFPAVATAYDPDVSFRSMSSGPWGYCGVSTSSDAWCWSSFSNYGKAPGGLSFRVTAGGQCGITIADDAYCWSSGSAPQLLPGGLKWANLTQGVASDFRTLITCGVATNGAGFCWGDGSRGQLGNGTWWTSQTPIRVPDPR